MAKKAPPQWANPRLSDPVLEGSKPDHYEDVSPPGKERTDPKRKTVHIVPKPGGWSRKKGR
jgi:hypothetical protein